jgi:hypothetical protein
MAQKSPYTVRYSSGRRSEGWGILLALALALAASTPAAAYVGDSFLRIPGLAGDWKGAQYKGWVRADANYWKVYNPNGDIAFGPTRIQFSGPKAPKEGASALVISVEKTSPVLSRLMDMCAAKTPIPQATYAESSVRSRTNLQYGARPAEIPEYFEYKLMDAQISDCPVVAEAPDQAFVVSFKNIEWLNYLNDGGNKPALFKPVNLQPAPAGPTTKSYVLTWFAVANYVNDAQCEKLNDKPTEDDYYALMTKEEADKERAENAKHGGPSFESGQMQQRGPHKLNVCLLPGIVKDPGQNLPRSGVARGFNLDGNDGSGRAPSGVCPHKDFVSEDGEPGIDNQLFAAVGCNPGYEGEKGFMMQFVNNQMHDGLLSILLQITGMKDAQNDRSVDVSIFYSLDPMIKNSNGAAIGSDYTFRVAQEPEYTHYFTRLHGRVKDGVLTTDPIKAYHMYLTGYGTPHELNLAKGRMRLKFMPDGSVTGIVGGYEDWRVFASRQGAEGYFSEQCPAVYNALRHAADGLKDPATGLCDGISAAYDIKGIPAFIAPATQIEAKDQEGGHRKTAQAQRISSQADR